MAIHSTLCNDDNRVHAAYAMSSKADDLFPNPLNAQCLISSGIANSNLKRRKSKNKAVYLCNNSIQLRSLTEEKSENKVVSSFQLAAKLYKSNSDELKITKKRRRKSNLKSVLTLPNEPAVLPQSCTVSDMNDNEYFSHIHKIKPQKTKNRQSLMKKSPKPPNYNYEYYDRDSAYCSHMNVFLDCSSVDVVKNNKGDCRRKVRNSKTESEGTCPSDVWAVLRNINRFQFDPSPPMSDSSYEVKPRKKKALRKKLNRSVYETCRTEEIAYFSNINLNVSRVGSHSGSSQITVIDKQVDLNKVEKRSLDRNIPLPLLNLKNRRQDLPKNNSKGNKNTKLKSNTKKTFASTDTLVDLKSEEKVNSKQSSNKGSESFEKSLRNNVCTTVDVQTETDFERKEVDKLHIGLQPRTYKSITSSGTMSDRLRSQNIYGPLNIKVPPQRPSRIQVPRRSRQQSPNIPLGRPLVNASSKVVVQPLGLTFSKLQDNPRVPHQTTADPLRPLPQTDIRKIIANKKFPIVILGKDQVSGTFEVEQYDYPQFRALDEHVWPFMVNWMEKPKLPKVNTVAQCKKQTLKNTTNSPEFDDFTIRNKKEQIGASHNNVERKNDVAKLKPASRLRDNVLKFLYKKDSNHNMDKDIIPKRLQRDATVNPAHIISTNARTSNYKGIDKAISNSSLTEFRPLTPKKRINPRFSTTPPPPTSPSKILIAPQKRVRQKIWGKTKWTSDFIENVINKIKRGTYYTNNVQLKDLKTTTFLENRTSDTSDLKLDSKEVSIQVTMSTVAEDFTPKVTIQKKKELIIRLPGFDDVVPQLEIKSMTRNQIAVKHCVMNVLLQFDVNVPSEADRTSLSLKRSTSCALLAVTESKTKVFKCKSKILNAVLPAELCSIVPRVMMQFMDKDASMAVTMKEEMTRNASLSTITEYAICEIQEPIKNPLLPQIEMSPELIWLRNGKFSKSPKSWAEKSNSNENFYIISIKELPYKYSNVEGILPLQLSNYRDDFFEVHPRRELVLNSTEPQPASSHLSCHDSATKPRLCTDLVLYTGNKVACGGFFLQITPQTALNELFSKMLTWNTNYFPAIQVQTRNNHVYVNFSINNHQGIGASLCIDATHFKYEPLFSVSTTNPSTSIVNSKRPLKQFEYIKHAAIKQSNRSETSTPLPKVAIIKKKGHVRYVKLYKKCKSTSHIVAERSSTPLSKVTNLDEFFQAMGTGKLLSSVCDGSCGKKILAYISDLRTYISGITPRQALMVMLLANKKDTFNLVRFRPMILQGIAVNRITRVSELDMEVEVIENEKFNKMQGYLDAPPFTVSPQNNDNLLEELIWIAKTTPKHTEGGHRSSAFEFHWTYMERERRTPVIAFCVRPALHFAPIKQGCPLHFTHVQYSITRVCPGWAQASDHQRRFDESSEKLLKTLLAKRKRLNPSYLRVMARYVGLGLLKTPVNH